MPIRLAISSLTDVGLVRKGNEDAFVVAELPGKIVPATGVTRFVVGESGAFVAVSDGMGGHRGGEIASKRTLESAVATLSAEPPSPDPVARLRTAVEAANHAVWELGDGKGQDRMGATLTAVLICGRDAVIAEVGDSRAYLIRGGVIKQVTKDQSLIQVLVDAGVVPPDRTEDAVGKGVLVQAMGLKPEVKVALAKLELRQRDCLLLCSDGLSNELSETEMRDTILGAASLDQAAALLVQRAKEHGGRDNITAVLVGVAGDLPALDPAERISSTLDILSTFDAPVSNFS
jgi:serine/threonine protein phosphatase PrpC